MSARRLRGPDTRRGLAQAQLGALLSGLVYPLLFPPFDLPGLSWIGLLPLVAGLANVGALGAACAGFVFGLTATLGVIGWVASTVHQYFGLDLGSTVAFSVLIGCSAAAPFFAVTFSAYASSLRHLPRASRPLLFAAAWVAAEFARTEIGLQSPWARLGDAHAGSAWLRQIADVTGVYGVSGLVALGNATAFEVLAALARAGSRRTRAARIARVSASFAALWTVTCSYGALALERWGDRPELFRVAIVQGNVAPELRWRRDAASKVMQRYARLTREALRSSDAEPIDLIVWPENAIQTPLADPVYGAAIRALARGGPPLLLGAPRFEREPAGMRSFNSAHLVRSDGTSLHYDKRRLVPFSETRPLAGFLAFTRLGDLDVAEFTPGREPGFFALGDVRLGVLICIEALYPELARELARGGAQAIVNLSNDGWYQGRGGSEQHLAQVIFRAVETRLPLVRSTPTGVSTIVSPDGTIQARLEQDAMGVLKAAVPRGTDRPTVYTRCGDVFAIGCASLSLGSLVWAQLQRFRLLRPDRLAEPANSGEVV